MNIINELKDIEFEIGNVMNIYPKDEDTIEYLDHLQEQRGKLLLLQTQRS